MAFADTDGGEMTRRLNIRAPAVAAPANGPAIPVHAARVFRAAARKVEAVRRLGLTVVIGAPAVHRAIRAYSAVVVGAGAYGLESDGRRRSLTGIMASVSHVGTPARHCAVRFYAAGMTPASGD